MNIKSLLTTKILQALTIAGITNICNIKIEQSIKKEFGDYQINGITNIAKKLNITVDQLSKIINDLFKSNKIANKIETLDPGFINIFLNPKWIAEQLNNILYSETLGISSILSQTIVVDYSSPNIAKEMHIGHLRSTIIGDSTARILSFLGHKVIRANHVGDWGTQFGMLIAYLKEKTNLNKELKIINLNKLEKIYREATKHYNKDSNFAKISRNYVVKLQQKDPICLKIWKNIVNSSIEENQKIYSRLNVSLTKQDIMGESLYQNIIPDVIQDLQNKGLAKKNNGAIVVFLDNFRNKQGNKMGVIIRKKDGAYLYTTTDIACIKYRIEILKATRIIYYTDSRQHQHLNQVWNIANQAGYINKNISIEHHICGMILDKNRKPFSTRLGKTIKIKHLLDESLKRTYNFILNKKLKINSDKIKQLAHIISIGAIKYADLSKNRTTNYVFNWNNMLDLSGNTSLYIQYAYVRILSILNRNNIKQKNKKNIILENKHEISLAINLLRFEETIITVAENGTPHILCNYLYNLSVLFSSFYESCPILSMQNNNIRYSRLQLIIYTAKILKKGLFLLGIETVEQM